MPSKIENGLSHEKLTQLLEELRALSGKPTLKQIQEAVKKYGLEVSLMGAKTFRDNSFEAHLQRLRRGRELSEAIVSSVRDGKSSALDAAEEIAAQELLDVMTDVDAEGRPNVAAISKVIVNLRIAASSRQDTARKLADSDAARKLAEARVVKLEDEKAERDRKKAELIAKLDAAKKKGGLTKESLAQIEEAAGLL